MRTLVITYIGLLALLALTVALSFLSLGPFSVAANLGIALAKAALIFWVFMQLREDSALIRVAALGALLWLGILLSLSFADFLFR